jgi:nicotinate-nucleotide pyrophosphorylase (carboxylating)
VVAGIDIACEVFRRLDSMGITVETAVRDGDEAAACQILATIRGDAAAILTGERTALNILGRMSGVATTTRSAVLEIEGTGAVILDTRKTMPGLRELDKYAVAAGGGTNHRIGLFDAVMIKDTHLGVTGSVSEAVRAALAAGHDSRIVTAEVRSVGQLQEAIEAGAGRALLDNMDVAALRECVAIGKGRIVLEASGGLRPGNLRAVAQTGVGFLSLGWLTHSASSADVAMEIDGGW